MPILRTLSARVLLAFAACTSSTLLHAADTPANPPILHGTFEYDGTAARQAFPHLAESIQKFLESTNRPDPRPDTERFQQLMIKYVTDKIAHIDHFTYEAAFDKDNITASYAVSPSLMPGHREFPKPLFPATALFTAHIAYPSPEAAQWLPNLITTIGDSALPFAHDDLTPEQLATNRTTFLDLFQLIASPDAASLDVENHNGRIVVTLVNQYDRDLNVPQQFRTDAEAMDALAKSHGQTSPPLAFEPLTPSDNSTGFRVTLPDSHFPSTLFITQKNHTAIFTLSFDPNPAPSLVELSPTEKITDILTSHADLSAIVAFAQTTSVWQFLPPDKQQQILTLTAGKSIDYSIYNDATSLHVTTTAPVDLIRAVFVLSDHSAPPPTN